MSALIDTATSPGRSPVVLVGPELEENLSLRYLASSLGRAGHRCEIVPFNEWGEVEEVAGTILDLAPRIVALSLAFQWRAKDMLALALLLRESGYRGHITAGGHFGTFAAGDLLRDFPELDSICLHESEETIVALAGAVAAGRGVAGIGGVATREEAGAAIEAKLPPLIDIAKLPWPDRRGAPATCLGHGMAPLVSSRGCYGRCHFCCIAEWHERTLPGVRYRSRPLDDVAEEMVALMRQRGIEIFVFHDDNFLVPGRDRSLERVEALADALEARGAGRFATVVKARPTDVDPEVFAAMKERLGLIRLYLGVETDSARGLRTLGRRVSQEQHRRAMQILEALEIYVCFNMLVFDPDTTPEDLEHNLRFMESTADCPTNFGRVELYAGTPLLRRMQAEDRCTGDYLGWDYTLSSPLMQRAFESAMRCFYPRNFASGSIANRLMGTRFDVEVARFFRPDRYEPEWLRAAKSISRRLTLESTAALREILAFEAREPTGAERSSFEADLSLRLRATEESLGAAASALERMIGDRMNVQKVLTGLDAAHNRESPARAEMGS